VGRTVNSFSGGFNTLATFGIYSFNLLNLSDPKNDISTMLTIYELTESEMPKLAKALAIGKVLGKIVTKIFNFQVPDV
jgi:hypothetical protein